MATSTAHAPSPEKNTCPKPAGARSHSRFANLIVVVLDMPKEVTCETFCSCSTIA